MTESQIKQAVASKRAIPVSELTLDQKRWISSFYGFARGTLGLPVYDGGRVAEDFDVRDGAGKVLYRVNGAPDWQRRALEAVDKHGSRVSIRTANGAGKTQVLIPAMVFAHMCVFPNSRIVITSGVQRQVREQVFAALKKQQGRFVGWDFQDTRIVAPNGSVCVGFSTDEGGKFEGWHGNPKENYFKEAGAQGPLMIIVDEAKSVPRGVFDAIERCTFQRLVLLSSCGEAEGEFHSSHMGKASAYVTVHAPASECPHADHAKNVLLIEQRGLADPLVQSKVFAQFMESEGATVMRRADVDALLAQAVSGGVSSFSIGSDTTEKYMCDFAAGGDENVFGARKGKVIELRACWRESDTMRACGQFILEFKKAGLSPDEAWKIHGDNSGLGRVMIDRLAELGWELTRVDNGAKPSDEGAYVNLAAEAWWEAAKAIERREFILPKDEQLAAQLSTRKPVFRNGRLGIESKDEMRKRGVDSPDRADVVVELMQPVRGLRVQQAGRSMTVFEQFEEEMGTGSVAGLAGIDAGN